VPFKNITGYLIELSLSIACICDAPCYIFDLLKFRLFYQHRVFIWGILANRIPGINDIFFGVALFTRFDWIIYVSVFFFYIPPLK